MVGSGDEVSAWCREDLAEACAEMAQTMWQAGVYDPEHDGVAWALADLAWDLDRDDGWDLELLDESDDEWEDF